MCAVTVSAPPVASTSPPAARPRRSAWRDPRLAVGLLLVAGSVLAGASLLDDSEQTTPVLAARTPLLAGTTVADEDLTSMEVRFVSAADADRYLPADTELPEGAVLTRDIGAGELVPRAALGAAQGGGVVEVPVPVSAERVPSGVRAGAVVDVWATDEAQTQGRLLAGEVAVRSVSRSTSGLRQVVVAVPADDDEVVARLVSHASPQSLLVVLRQG